MNLKANIDAMAVNGKLLYVLFSVCFIASCVNNPRTYPVNPDRMEQELKTETDNSSVIVPENQAKGGFTRLDSMSSGRGSLQQAADVARQFSDSDQQQAAINQLPVRDFIQTIFGELLKVNYIIADDSKASTPVTLNLSQSVSSRQLYLLSAQVLEEQGLSVSKRDDIFYIHTKNAETRGDVVIGLGRRHSDVPDSVSTILQVVPLRFGVKTSLERTIRELTNARITADMEQNAFFVEGTRAEVLKVLDLISLLDVSSTRGRYVGMLQLTYVSPTEIVTKLTELLDAEGITAATRSSTGVALLLVPIEQVGSVAIFAGDEQVLERAEFWAGQIDRPTQGKDKSYYVYHPRFARAGDLGLSLAPLISGVSSSSASSGNTARDTQSAQTDAPSQQSIASAVTSNADMTMTVDDRSNTLLFHTKGSSYQALLPIIKRLDVLPKQILLDATIAEVSMTDEFAQGFEFAFRSGKLSGGTVDSLGLTDAGFNLDWTDGVAEIFARLSASNNLINVLSNPTLVVRDGVSATIKVGDDIPTIGSTTTNPNTESQTRAIVYRKTGVTLTVKPTINAQGMVILEIDQTISNSSTTGPTLEGALSIFERSIQTEVLAQSGQTILLGGLISEDSSGGQSEVPGLVDLPLLGNLFKGVEQKKKKTELVIFITPRIIDDMSQWKDVRRKLSEGLTSIKLSD